MLVKLHIRFFKLDYKLVFLNHPVLLVSNLTGKRHFFIAVCKALKNGMAGLFGPQSSVTSSHIQSICDTLEIPHIETRWDYRMKRDDYSVNLYPHPHALGQVCQICTYYLPSDLKGKLQMPAWCSSATKSRVCLSRERSGDSLNCCQKLLV